ncbi:hypothetical protein CJ030_MR5G005108 [Morella rubra]|uniref:Uncharacterized protein n=1 Tax=Morella rubra TaxID=262757 RepID=A0A6A1VJ73_9ROSI|nr:hypothetical protein CJ030_MR5G005108 [Morella rubra]
MYKSFVRKNGGIKVATRVKGKPYIEVEIFVERLEEARLKIEKMRTRQMEYEEFMVKRSEMEQTMWEYQLIMEEQQ